MTSFMSIVRTVLYAFWTVITSSTVSAFATVVAAVSTAITARYALRAARASEESLTVVQRARVFPYEVIDVREIRTGSQRSKSAYIAFRNYGTTPAHNLSVTYESFFVDKREESQFRDRPGYSPHRVTEKTPVENVKLFLAQSDTFGVQLDAAKSLSDHESVMLTTPDGEIRVIGTITYLDVFRNEHETNWKATLTNAPRGVLEIVAFS